MIAADQMKNLIKMTNESKCSFEKLNVFSQQRDRLIMFLMKFLARSIHNLHFNDKME